MWLDEQEAHCTAVIYAQERGITLQDVHADQLGTLGSAAEFVLQEVPSLSKKQKTKHVFTYLRW